MKMVYATFKDAKQAEKIVNSLLKQRLIACANIIPNIKSSYLHKGKIANAKEAAAIMKTADEKIDDVINEIRRMHSYEVPEIISFEIAKGNAQYMDWIIKEVRKNEKG
ncbi:MAG: divalent-cation tolerance protein CutA [Candidatus Diapherotrites archaeon]|uniref:Divalent-cation tolerance protein CutA n=1 Tax=Candidatus Iainarchaeum sp. TaxID=3101447 RepID=A0A8T4KZX0_9ARCH|nr:divalent-cation tolerance protein CutA [Candidatus Diapherotrites archaeon]